MIDGPNERVRYTPGPNDVPLPDRPLDEADVMARLRRAFGTPGEGGPAVAVKHYGPGPHESGSPQTVHGHGGDVASPSGHGEFTKGEATNLTKLLSDQGGFTYQPFDDTSPSDGFMLSIYSDREHIVKGAASSSNLMGYVGRNRDLLARSDHYLGAWADEGKTYLDVSMRVTDATEARDKCCEHSQLAYFDLAKMETVYVTC